MISISVVKGDKIKHYVKYIASLRLMMFREFPYLYEGTMEYEEKYLSSYGDLLDDVLVLAKERELVIGLLTGMPVKSFCSHFGEFKTVMENNKRSLEEAYYYGEALVLPGYRGQGIVTKLFQAIETEIQKMNYKKAYGITVIRDTKDPLRPKNYQETDKLWEYLGLKKTHITLNAEWPTLTTSGEARTQVNQLLLWEKIL